MLLARTNGTTNTLAGSVAPSNDQLTPGCVTPCLRGVPGYRDGNLTFAQFNSPRDVAIGPQKTVVVADGHRIRRVNYDGTTSQLETIESSNRVVTLAGSNVLGGMDGAGEEATFNSPSGVTLSADGRVYVVSPVSCKLRMISTAALVARAVTCSTTAAQVLLPSGCSSYEPEVDERALKISPAVNNIFYNYRQRRDANPVDGLTLPGRRIKACTGTPPIDALETGNLSLPLLNADNSVRLDLKEDQEDGTTIKVRCPASCAASSTSAVYGSTFYTDASSICRAAVHAGALNDSVGGLLDLMLERGVGFYNDSLRLGSTANGVTSLNMSSVYAAARLFSVRLYPVPQVHVQTIAGSPMALLKSGCGFKDGMPPLAAQFNGPSGVEMYSQTNASRSQLVFIADSRNHRIRQITAVCSKACENGGVCVAAETCSCASGWSGDDCTVPVCSSVQCTGRQLCVGPNECGCIPGYTGAPACTTPLCVQRCQNGGRCSAPDTCTCSSGWFDSNCTTPVCTQTCGNGGNCTAPDTCTCASEWQDVDCRVPVCSQTCANGGSCVAPGTCLCATGWSGYDCTLPICSQGFFVPNPSGYLHALGRPLWVPNYVPCDLGSWCNATNEFDCLGRLQSPTINVSFGAIGRHTTGRVIDPAIDPMQQVSGRPECLLIELGDTALSDYQYLTETNASTGFFRLAPQTPYGWNASNAAWRAIATSTVGFSPPFTTSSDRQVALVEARAVVQGVYACANQGDCIAPDVCSCASGWIGFDCRTPVCSQGYYVPSQAKFFASDPPEAVHPSQPTSNPTYQARVEVLAYDHVTVTTVTRGGVRYQPSQGGYACSVRSLTQWEKPLTIGPNASAEFYLNHPNYYSRYMDQTVSADGFNHTQWQGMYWPPLYDLTTPLLDDTREGWRRAGIWELNASNHWQKGKCLVQFNRTCSASGPTPLDLVSMMQGVVVADTDASYRPRSVYTIANVTRWDFWNQTLYGTGGCVDYVLRGCFNNGTCVAPDTCACASGWSGSDCSVPVCEQQCLHSGNCTLPNTCTCERGWTGTDCSIPLCAQECRNGGRCVAPDTCECKVWASTWRDGRENGGKPVFQNPDGSAQLTGYTGFDCNTPICVQAETFVLNSETNSATFESLRGHGKNGSLTCSTYRCPQYDEQVVGSDGHSFQSGCSAGSPRANPVTNLTVQQRLTNLLHYQDELNTGRVSDGYLCGNLVWEQGDYTDGRYTRSNYVNVTKVDEDSWAYGTVTPGEGVFQCYNKGSCLAPDTCTCGDGWQGIDCNVPLCRFLQANGSMVKGCLNDGVCVDKDTCRCIQVRSVLNDKDPTMPPGLTGYFGSDCSLPICVQGVFDPWCNVTGSAGVDGCYRCRNGGQCVAPDICKCAEGWSGVDCGVPICQVANVTSTVRKQLFTVDDAKVAEFQADPCGSGGGRWGKEMVNGALVGQGNCTKPAKCTCLCRTKYDAAICKKTGKFCEKPWSDPFHRSIPAGYIYGTRDCVDGFQGLEDADGNFLSCHLQIYVPSLFRRYTVSMVSILSVLGAIFLMAWYYIRKRVRRMLLLAKAERRRSRKQSEEVVNKARPGAFVHPKQE